MIGKLVLENGITFKGNLFGYVPENCEISGEVVFQTGMTGYVETLTDPSYKEQILVFTYPIIGNYGVPNENVNEFGFSESFESNGIHTNAIVVQEIVDKHSHWESNKSLSNWLMENKVIGISGIDTRKLTKIIREHGSMKGKIIKFADNNLTITYEPKGLVGKVSRKTVFSYFFNASNAILKKIIVIDCGIKNSQINILMKKIKEKMGKYCNYSIEIVPFNYNFSLENVVGVFVSNGPGDPRDDELKCVVSKIREVIDADISLFGICLGHQLIALAKGYEIEKMKYGNRGHNIPVILNGTKRAFITSQNHGFAVKYENDFSFYNLNDNSNEGIIDDNSFSVQFHPEARGGPNDTTFLFDIFLNKVMYFDFSLNTRTFTNILTNFFDNNKKIKKSLYDIKPNSIKKILLLGSGGLSIGQAGEFDYSGTQAIKSFKEEGIEVILVNPNIATIQTSKGLADKIYYLPVTFEYVKQIIEDENPDCIALSFGGQTALNCGVELYEAGIIGEEVKILGTPVEAIQITEDRDKFRKMLSGIGEECAPSDIAYNLLDAVKIADEIGYPVLVRAAFALGGLGSGFAKDKDELIRLVETALCHSSQIIIDKSLKGWKEVEYEIVRDCQDNCIAVCNMENLDPLGVHTGESIVVAPSQTLNDKEYFKLRDTAIKVIRELGVIGECNIQYALDPKSQKYYIIEVNARLSRSSALASKATGYPLAYIAGKLGLGYSLIDLSNKVTNTSSFFEPSLDYCVVKVPRWDLNKFPLVNQKIGSSMKSVGEVMSISRSFEEAFQKGLRMANNNLMGFDWTGKCELTRGDVIEELQNPTPNRIQVIAHVLLNENKELNMSVDEVHRYSHIDKWFLYKMEGIKRYAIDNLVSRNILKNSRRLFDAKKLGFSDKYISYLSEVSEFDIIRFREEVGMKPVVKQIDTVAGEFPCFTNYLYLTYNGLFSDVEFNDNGITVLGSGVYRIGSSVEFDWCAVNCIKELREEGYKTIMINYNPETVSTDYDEADRLYFDELSLESVYDIYCLEGSKGIILSMGGQVANNIALQLDQMGVNIIGTRASKIDEAEDRYKFSKMLDNLWVNQPKWKELSNEEEVYGFCNKVGFPCLVRPSYVLSGAAMNVAYSIEDLKSYLNEAVSISKEHPVVISKFIIGAKEIEIDAVAYKGDVKLLAVSEHVENAGVHSGDATLILPAQDLTKDTIRKLKNIVAKISKELDITGPFNIQFMAKNDELYVIECNLRASRSMPFVSKVFDVNFIRVATQYIMNGRENINDNIFNNNEGLMITKSYGRYWEKNRVGVKVPQFSFSRLDNADIKLGVEMRSTGEVACFGENKYEAYLKGLRASKFNFSDLEEKSILISIGSDEYREEFMETFELMKNRFNNILFTPGTGNYYGADEDNILTYDEVISRMKKKEIGFFIAISRSGNFGNKMTNGWRLRRTAIDTNTSTMTNIKCIKMFIKAFIEYNDESLIVKDVDYVCSGMNEADIENNLM
jgi:carbamoyl-phosphate synthase / aspartate carbamoyltransferase / dihydroorotase